MTAIPCPYLFAGISKKIWTNGFREKWHPTQGDSTWHWPQGLREAEGPPRARPSHRGLPWALSPGWKLAERVRQITGE